MDFPGYTEYLPEDTTIDLIPTYEPSQSKPSKRSANFTKEEDVQLCLSWESISSDPIISNEQPSKAYWMRITEHFHANRTFESDRSKNSLEHRWGTIQKECQKFQGIFEDVERRQPSGVPHTDYIFEAEAIYGGKKKGFPFLHCWYKVRNSAKFQALNPKKRKVAAANKQKAAASNATSSNPINLDEVVGGEGMGSPHTPDSSQIAQRPIGRKRAKEQLKNKGVDNGSYKNVVQELLVERKDEKKQKTLRWQEAKAISERRLSIEEKRLMWDQEKQIMFCDVSTLDNDQKNYVLTMRAQLAAQKVAEFSQSLGGSSGGSRDVGDGLGGDPSI